MKGKSSTKLVIQTHIPNGPSDSKPFSYENDDNKGSGDGDSNIARVRYLVRHLQHKEYSQQVGVDSEKSGFHNVLKRICSRRNPNPACGKFHKGGGGSTVEVWSG